MSNLNVSLEAVVRIDLHVYRNLLKSIVLLNGFISCC